MSKVSTYSVKLINTNYNTLDVPKQKVRTVGQLFPYCLKRLKVPYFSIAGFPTVSIEYNKNNYSFDFSLAKLNYKSGDTIYMYFPKSMNIFFKIKSPQCQNEKIKKTHFETDYVRDAKLSLSMDLKVPFHFIKLYYIDEQELKDEIKLTNLIRKKENPMELYLLYEINCLECTFQNKTLNQRLKIYPLFIEPGTTISEIKAIISHKNNLSESEIILKNKDEELNNDFLVIKNMKLSIEKGRKEPKSNIPVIKLESINKNIFTILQSLKFPNNHSLNRLKQTIIDEYSKFGIIIPYSMIIFNLIEVEPKKKSKSQGSKTKNKKSETERQIETYIVQCKKFIIQFIFGNEKLQLEVTYFDKIIDAKNELSKKLNQEISCLSIFYDNSPIDDNENIYKYKDLNLTLNCTKSINVKINFLKPDGAIFSVDIDRHHSFAEIYDDFIYSYDYFELLFEDEIIHRDTPVSKFANNRTPIVIQLCNPICTFILNSKEKVTYELDETKKIKEIISDLMKMYPNQVNSHSKIYYQDTPITKTSELKSYQKTFLIKSEIKCQETISHIRTNQQKKSLHYHEPSTNEQSTPNKYRPQLVQIEPKKRKLSKDTSKNPAVDATIDSSPNSFREVTFIIFQFTFGQKRCDLDYNVQYTSFLQYLQDIKFPKPKLFVFTLNRKEIEITQLFNHKNIHNSIHVHIAPKGKQNNKYGFRFKEIFRNYKFDLQVSVNDIIRSVWEDFRLFNYSLNSLVLSFWDIIIDGKEILGNLSLPQGSKFELLDKSSIKLIICKSSQNFEINASEKDSVSDLKVNLEKLFKEYKGLLYLNGVTVNGSDLVSKYNQQILTIDQPDLSFKRDLNDDKRELLDNSNKMLEFLFNVDGEKFRFRANQETTVGEAINEIQSYVLEGKAEVKICDCDMEVLDDEIFLKDANIPLNLIRTILISFEYEKTNRTINHKVWSSDILKSIRPKIANAFSLAVDSFGFFVYLEINKKLRKVDVDDETYFGELELKNGSKIIIKENQIPQIKEDQNRIPIKFRYNGQVSDLKIVKHSTYNDVDLAIKRIFNIPSECKLSFYKYDPVQNIDQFVNTSNIIDQSDGREIIISIEENFRKNDFSDENDDDEGKLYKFYVPHDDRPNEEIELILPIGTNVLKAKSKISEKLKVKEEAITIIFAGKALKPKILLDRLRLGNDRRIQLYIKSEEGVEIFLRSIGANSFRYFS